MSHIDVTRAESDLPPTFDRFSFAFSTVLVLLTFAAAASLHTIYTW